MQGLLWQGGESSSAKRCRSVRHALCVVLLHAAAKDPHFEGACCVARVPLSGARQAQHGKGSQVLARRRGQCVFYAPGDGCNVGGYECVPLEFFTQVCAWTVPDELATHPTYFEHTQTRSDVHRRRSSSQDLWPVAAVAAKSRATLGFSTTRMSLD